MLEGPIDKLEFQSLVGFKINWNNPIDDIIAGVLEFQSLVGFKINWNFLLFRIDINPLNVSIPSRV